MSETLYSLDEMKEILMAKGAYIHDQKKLYCSALAYIRQLESTNAELLTRCERLERERDAAVADLTYMAQMNGEPWCEYCKYNESVEQCLIRGCRTQNEGFEWRGVKEE